MRQRDIIRIADAVLQNPNPSNPSGCCGIAAEMLYYQRELDLTAKPTCNIADATGEQGAQPHGYCEGCVNLKRRSTIEA